VSRNEAVFLQVLNSRLEAIVSELAENVLRAAHSTFIKETWDIAALLMTPEGEVFSCPREVAAKRIGMHLGMALEALGADRPGAIAPGDIFITNDPQSTGGLATHLNDMFLWKPVFWGERLVCFALVFVHLSDVGGLVPGSLSPAAVDIYQEGLRIPPMHLYRRGELIVDLRRLMLTNSRVPAQTWGDVTAVVGALNVCEKHIGALAEEYTAEEFAAGTQRLLDTAERRARALIAEIPDGSYRFVDYIDGLPNMEPIRLALVLTVAGDEMILDFSGSDPEVGAAYNLYSYSIDGHWGLTRALADYFQGLDPDVPWNSGLVRPLRIRAPKGSVVNPEADAACGMRVATYFRIYYMTFGALAEAAPGRIPASGPAEAGIMLIATHDRVTGKRRINVGQAMFGGSGGRAADDGFDGNEMVSWYLRNVPMEILEQEVDVRFLSYGIAPGTGGAGRYRGGHGTRISVEFLTPATVTIRGLQRHQFRAWGVDGGAAGARGTVVVRQHHEGERRLDAVTLLDLREHDVLTVVTPGGGGCGDPFARPAELVAHDVREGLIDAAQAAAEYGVVVAPDGSVDAAATAAGRAAPRASLPAIDYGPERVEFERWWTPELYAAIAELLKPRNAAERKWRRRHLLEAIRRRMAEGVRTTPEDLPRLLAEPARGRQTAAEYA